LTKKELEKERKREEIIKAAEELFFSEGFDATSMDNIARSSEFSKRTIYKYFSSKEELYATIAYKGIMILSNIVKDSLYSGVKVSEVMINISKNLINLRKNNKNYPRAISYLLSLITKSHAEGINLTKCINALNDIFNTLKELLERGKEDGSIKKEIDITKTIYSIQMIFAGIYSINQNVFNFVKKNGYNVSFDEIFEYNFYLLTMAIKN